MKFWRPDLSTRVWAVWQRDFDVFRRTFIVNFALPMLEPALYILALGFGLGFFIRQINGVPYARFIAPALVATAAMYASFFECTYASFVRMIFQKTFDAIVATPLTVEEVVAGEIVWGATRAAFNATLVLIVVLAFGLASPLLIIPVPIIAFVAGLVFASVGMIFTSFTRTIDMFNYPVFLFITPMFLFSGTFFPITVLPPAVQVVSFAILPLTHVVNILRAVSLNGFTWGALGSILWLLLVGVVTFYLALFLMRRRLVR